MLAARALRRLGHAIVGHQVDDDLLTRIASAAESLLPEIEAGDARIRLIKEMKRSTFGFAPIEDGALEHFPECIVSGRANPMGAAIEVRKEGSEAVSTVSFGAAFEGAPQRAHGGVVAAVFDDVMGYVLAIEDIPAFTGRLSVTYRAPTPVGVDVEFRARLIRRDRRKVFIEAEATAGGKRLAQAEGVFITVPLERLGL